MAAVASFPVPSARPVKAWAPIPYAIQREYRLKPGPMCTLTAISHATQDARNGLLSYAEIAYDTCNSERQAYRNVKILRLKGLIDVMPGGGRFKNRYRLTWDYAGRPRLVPPRTPDKKGDLPLTSSAAVPAGHVMSRASEAEKQTLELAEAGGSPEPFPPVTPSANLSKEVEERCIRARIDRPAAQRLVRMYALDRIRLNLELVAQRQRQGYRPSNPGGFARRAIEKNFAGHRDRTPYPQGPKTSAAGAPAPPPAPSPDPLYRVTHCPLCNGLGARMVRDRSGFSRPVKCECAQ